MLKLPIQVFPSELHTPPTAQIYLSSSKQNLLNVFSPSPRHRPAHPPPK